jgi:hypothetical protein
MNLLSIQASRAPGAIAALPAAALSSRARSICRQVEQINTDDGFMSEFLVRDPGGYAIWFFTPVMSSANAARISITMRKRFKTAMTPEQGFSGRRRQK